MTAFARYTGLVRARESCWLNNLRLSADDVVPVKDLVLWADDPFEPVEVVGEVMGGADRRPRGCEGADGRALMLRKVGASIYPVGLRAEYNFNLGK